MQAGPYPASRGSIVKARCFLREASAKCSFPALRIGYLVLPPDLVDSFAAAKSVLNRHAPPFEQTVLCDFMVEGHLERHLRRMREVYTERCRRCSKAPGGNSQDYWNSQEVEAGLQTVGWLQQGIDSKTARRAAEARKVEVIPLRVYSRGPPIQRQGLQWASPR